MNEYLLLALIKKLEGEIALHKANIRVYMDNPAGIGEHPQHIDEIDKLFQKIADAQEKLEAIKDFREPRNAL